MTATASPTPLPTTPIAPAQRCGSAAAPPLTSLTIVLPCFNEAENVRATVRNAAAAAEMTRDGYEILVVDDGSTDGTAGIAAALAATDPHVRVIVHERNRGYGDALRSGIDAARMDWVLLMDADRQFDVHDLARFLPGARSHDALWGRRVLRQDRRSRRAAAAAWNHLVRALFRLPVRDIDCGFKLIRRDLLQDFELRSSGALISTELAVRCRAAGTRIDEIDVPHHPRLAGRETGGDPRVVLRAFRELAAMHGTLRHL